MTANGHADQPPANRPETGAIVLAGFMGSGKSTVGREIARHLGWQFVDLDQSIERLASQTIPRIFEEAGESGFRDWEHAALSEQARRALGGSQIVLALGGGTYAFERNRDLLRSFGVTIWLDADPETLWGRVHNESHRPLAQDREAFLRLHETRRESYERADLRIDASGAPDEIASRIIQLRWRQGPLADA